MILCLSADNSYLWTPLMGPPQRSSSGTMADTKQPTESAVKPAAFADTLEGSPGLDKQTAAIQITGAKKVEAAPPPISNPGLAATIDGPKDLALAATMDGPPAPLPSA